jgi:hypothetical protein
MALLGSVHVCVGVRIERLQTDRHVGVRCAIGSEEVD